MTEQTIWAEQALTSAGWQNDVLIQIGSDGRITQLESDAQKEGVCVGALLPSPANLHSHAFQRAMAGLTERPGARCGAAAHDNFWSWRTLMYRFLDRLGPDDIQAISAFVYMQMLEAGFSAVGEFHYLHHQPDGKRYSNLAETSERICAAASEAGIGLTLLPVLYQRGGCDDRQLSDQQRRFGNGLAQYQQLVEQAAAKVSLVNDDSMIGVAPHSLRAVSPEAMQSIDRLIAGGPIHIHIAEQTAENEEVRAAMGQTPVQWLLEHCAVNERWCLVHATHMSPAETTDLAASGAVAGLCPITEANLGDGIFNGAAYLNAGGRFGIGSDSNVRISLTEELRTLEYSQRLKNRARTVLSDTNSSTGRTLFEGAARGGALALERQSGVIAVGQLADLTALNTEHIELTGLRGDFLLDSAIFAGDDQLVTDVWSAGRHCVADGRHKDRDTITHRYRAVIKTLRQDL
jgi:formimidoylglutamate deiminase